MAGALQPAAATQAVGAEQFVQSIGVNTHIDFSWTGYGNTTAVESALSYLGVQNVRDSGGAATDLAAWQQVAQATGVKFDDFIGETSPAGYVSQLALMKSLANEGVLNFIEGGNEPDDSYPASLGTTTAFAANFQQQVWALGQQTGLKVIQTSFGYVNDYGSTGNLSAYADYGNAHTYFGTGNNPGIPAYWNGASYPNTMAWLNSEAGLTTPGKPVIVTESGYYTDGNAADPSSVDTTVQAKYTLDILLDGFKNGDVKTYLYELMDEGAAGDGNPEDNFGLFYANGQPKPAATAVHNLITLLSDPKGGSMSPAALNYSLSGLGSTDNTLLMEKSDGSYWLAIWNDSRLSGPINPTDVSVPPHTVTLTLAQPAAQIAIFDPLTGTTAIQTASSTTSMQVAVPDHPVLVEIVPGSGHTNSGPVIGLPAGATDTAGTSIAVAGVSISDPLGSQSTMSVTLTASGGTIAMTDGSGHMLPGSGTGTIRTSGTLAQIDADLATLSFAAGPTAGGYAISVTATDQSGVTATKAMPVTVNALSSSGPSIALPAKASVGTGHAIKLAGIAITDPIGNGPGTMALNLSASGGTIRLPDGSGASLPGSGTTAISVAGTMAQLNAELAGLVFKAGTSSGSGSVSVDVWDQYGLETTKAIPVTITPAPVVTLPPVQKVQANHTLSIGGISVADSNASAGSAVTLQLTATGGTVSMAAVATPVAGSGSNAISVTGTLAQIDADLAHLTYHAGNVGGSFVLAVNVQDAKGAHTTKTLGVKVTQPAQTPLLVLAGGSASALPAVGQNAGGGTSDSGDTQQTGMLDLRAALGATGWNGGAAGLGSFLQMLSDDGAPTALPTGSSGASVAAGAIPMEARPLDLPMLLAHATP